MRGQLKSPTGPFDLFSRVQYLSRGASLGSPTFEGDAVIFAVHYIYIHRHRRQVVAPGTFTVILRVFETTVSAEVHRRPN